jgi:hypothetical protein
VVAEPAPWVIKLPHPPLQAAHPLCSPIWKRTFVRLNYHTYVKNKRENLFGWGTITCVKYVCKIGLKFPNAVSFCLHYFNCSVLSSCFELSNPKLLPLSRISSSAFYWHFIFCLFPSCSFNSVLDHSTVL